jgi:hypothetical protein
MQTWPRGGVEAQPDSFFTLALGGVGFLTSRPGRFTTGKSSGTRFLGGWMSSTVGLGRCGKEQVFCLSGILTQNHPAPWILVVQTNKNFWFSKIWGKTEGLLASLERLSSMKLAGHTVPAPI